LNTRRSDKKIYVTAFFICLLLLAGSIALTYNIAVGGNDSLAAIGQFAGKTGKVQFLVVDGFTEKPLDGATVVILDTNKQYRTDKDGLTTAIDVPIIEDKRFDSIIPKAWGEVSAVIYRKDYIPYALFYLQVFPEKTRKGVKILLFKKGEITSDEPFSIIEGPNRIWVEEVIKKYQPKE